MSLYIKLANSHDAKCDIYDVLGSFMQLTLQDNHITRTLIREIESGSYNDSTSYIDRFGFKRSILDMSEGCKAALCVAYYPHMTVSTIECGDNAIDAIIANLKTGSILLHLPHYMGIGDCPIDVICEGVHFRNSLHLGYYLEKEYPLKSGALGGDYFV